MSGLSLKKQYYIIVDKQCLNNISIKQLAKTIPIKTIV